MIRRVATLILLSFSLVKIVFAQSIYEQKWENIEISSSKVINQDRFGIISNGQKSIYRLFAQGSEGLVIERSLSKEKHHIALAAETFFITKSCLFITTSSQGSQEPFGFYVIRLIDLHYHGFRSPIPFFFIPTNASYGKIQKVVVKSDADGKESELFLKTSDSKNSVIEMEYKDVQDVIKGQLFLFAVEQVLHNPELQKELASLIHSAQTNIKNLYHDLFTELKRIPLELKNLDLEKVTYEDISNILSTLDDHSELVQLKLRYTEKLSELLLSFYVQYNALMENVELTFNISTDDMKHFSNPKDVSETLINREDRLQKDTQSAYQILLGATTIVVFTRFILPKLVKKPFSQMAADFCVGYRNTLNSSWIRTAIRKIHPELLKQENWLINLISKLSPQEFKYAGIQATSEHYQRAIFQVSGNTLTIMASELLFRPWIRKVGEEESQNAIFIDQPFDEMHSVWIQKNVLYNILSNQIVWPLGNIPSLALVDANMTRTPAQAIKPGVIKKCFMAVGNALGNSMQKILGKRFVDYSGKVGRDAWNQWVYGLEPSLWTSMITQNMFRGGFNLTLWSFNRAVSLAVLIPFYNESYSLAKRKFGVDKNIHREFIFGLAYGLIASPIYSYLLLYMYEKPLAGTEVDLEFKPLELFWGENATQK